jgi:CrcB protein
MLARYILIGVGGALGSVARYVLSGAFAATQFGTTFPLGTLVVNVSGSLVIGFLYTATEPDGRWFANPATRDFLMVGICGGYTTFSSFSLNTLNLARNGEWLHAGGNIVASVILCLVAVWLGHSLAAFFNQAR